MRSKRILGSATATTLVVAVATTGCGGGGQVPTYTNDPTFSKPAQLLARLEPALAHQLPDTFACITSRSPRGRLRVYLTDPTAVSRAESIVTQLGGRDLATVSVTADADPYVARRRLLRELRAEAPDGVAINEQTSALQGVCPKIGVDARADPAWLRRVRAEHPGRVVAADYTVDAGTGTGISRTASP